jgi:hypothetical protein
MAQPTALTVSIRLLFILIGIGGIHVHGQLQTEYTLDVQLLDQIAWPFSRKFKFTMRGKPR